LAFFRWRRQFILGTAIAIPCSAVSGGVNHRQVKSLATSEEQTMNNRLFWAFLWVIGLPLPLVIILYMLFGHHG
jgi:hypothetical protein